MATAKSVWGIDIGQCALKALKLNSVEGQVQVEAFDVIEHPKMLGQPDADSRQLIQNALEQFLARNSVVNCDVAIAVPGRSSFTRFVKLPPVEPKKIPDIVRFEAEQQIPFPIDEVLWRWQSFSDPDSPDVEVGLFAMKRVDISQTLEHFTAAGINVNQVQMAPLALYNFMTFDQQVAEEGATLLADVGTYKTDLVVADGGRIWTRTIQIGGRNFTEALEKAFKLSFPKAEKLKRNAATNKYARQIFQAMRPVFADLVQEIQRSIGYYTSLHRDARFQRMIGLGNGFRLPGLQKFLEQNLNMPVVRVDSFNQLNASATVNAPTFTENVLSFAVVYGLALQGLGMAPVSTNLLPDEIARKRRWARKRPWFAAAAAVAILVPALWAWRGFADAEALADTSTLNRVASQVAALQREKTEFRQYDRKAEQQLDEVSWYRDLYKYRNFWPNVLQTFYQAIGEVAADQRILSAGDEQALERLKAKPREQRKLLFVQRLETQYVPDVTQLAPETTAGAAGAGAPGGAAGPIGMGPMGGMPGGAPAAPSPTASRRRRGRAAAAATPAAAQTANAGFKIILTARTPLPKDEAFRSLVNPLILKTQQLAQGEAGPFDIHGTPKPSFAATTGATRTGGGGSRRRGYGGRGAGMYAGMPGMDMGAGAAQPEDLGPEVPDPLFPDEDMVNDTQFTIEWVITVEHDGVTPIEPEDDAQASAGPGR